MRFRKVVIYTAVGCMLVPTVAYADEVTTEVPTVSVTTEAPTTTETPETALYKNDSQVSDVQDYFKVDSAGTTLQELNNGDVNKIVQIPNNIVVPNIEGDGTVSIKEKASDSSATVARMKPNTFATVVDDESYDKWIKVEVNGIEGYLYKENVLEGDEAIKYIQDNVDKYKTGVALLKGTFAIGVYGTPEDSVDDKFEYTVSAEVVNNAKMYKEKTTGEFMKSEKETVERAVVHCDEEGTYLYQEKDEESVRVGMVFNKNKTEIVEKADDWCKVTNSAGITGYIKTSLVKFKEVKLDIPNEITELEEGSEVEILEEGETWVKVKYTDKTDEENPIEYEGYMERMNLLFTYTPTEECKAVDTLAYGDAFEVIEEEEVTNPDFIKTSKGFVKKTYLTDSVLVDTENIQIVKKKVKKDKVINYDLGGIPKGKAREVIEYALKFVGNPYVWGGTSLTKGADCSGFVQSVYKHFGYELPRVAKDQANAYREVKLKDVKPGDLLFYRGKDGVIGHVTMYIGNNQVVHASNSRLGIIVSKYNYRNPVSAIRLLDDEDLKDVKADSTPVTTEEKKLDKSDKKSNKKDKDKVKESTLEIIVEDMTEQDIEEEIKNEVNTEEQEQ